MESPGQAVLIYGAPISFLLTLPKRSTVMADKIRQFASAAAAAAVTISRPNYFEGGKKGTLRCGVLESI